MKSDKKPDNVVVLPDAAAQNNEAAEWLLRLDLGNLTQQEYADFYAWRDSNPKHLETFERLSALWEDFDCVEALAGYAPSIDEATPRELRTAGASWRVFLHSPILAGLAASFVLIVAGVLFFIRVDGVFGAGIGVYQTAIGEQETITLSDGSKIYLNTKSRVRVSYTETARHIRLAEGEAYFDVAPDKERPFSVLSGGKAVTAVGTAFSVRLREKKLHIAVEEGRVALFPNRPAAPAKGSAEEKVTALGPTAEIIAGQNAILDDTVETITKIAPDQLARQLSWREGVLAFSGDPLSRVLSEVGRYTDVSIEIEDSDLLNMPVNGYFKIGDVEEMFEALEILTGLNMEHVDPKRVRFVDVREG